MSQGWASDFSYAYYRRLLDTAAQDFRFHTVCDAAQALSQSDARHLILRHDVDVDLERAIALAEIEHALAVRSTFMVMLNSPFYDPSRPDERSMLQKLIEMGHEVALHFDFDHPEERNESTSVDATLRSIEHACIRLEELLGQPVRSISFHKPLPQFLRGPLHIDTRVNAYARDLMDWYLSDSKGIWREGEPLIRISGSRQRVLQLLTHPIWWGQDHQSSTERLHAFSVDWLGRGRKPVGDELDDMLFRHIGLRAHA